MSRRSLLMLVGAAVVLAAAGATSGSLMHSADAAQGRGSTCRGLPSAAELRKWLVSAPALTGAPVGGTVGGLFDGKLMWAAVVNRAGEICAYTTSTEDPTDVWPGSQAIAKAKAYTANAFSLDALALSSARLYTFTQPNHSLWSLGQSNPFNPDFLLAPGEQGGDRRRIAGGLIFFGGGVPLYRNGEIIGGLGISGEPHARIMRWQSACVT